MSNKISFKNSSKKFFYLGLFFLFGVVSNDFIKEQISNFKEFQSENTYTKNLKVVNCPIDNISIGIFGQSNSSNSVTREKPIEIPLNFKVLFTILKTQSFLILQSPSLDNIISPEEFNIP